MAGNESSVQIRALIKGLNDIKNLKESLGGIKKETQATADVSKKWYKDTFPNFLQHIRYTKQLQADLHNINKFLAAGNREYKEEGRLLEQINRIARNKPEKQRTAHYQEGIKGVNTGIIRDYEEAQGRQASLESQIYQRKQAGQFAKNLGMAIAIPAAYAGIRAIAREYITQETIMISLAPRLADVNKGFSENIDRMKIWEGEIAQTAVQFGYAGSEGLKVAEVFNKISGFLPDEKSIMKFSRAYGISPEQTAQSMGTMARYGALDKMTQETLANTIAGAIEKTGMSPRSQEFLGSVTSVVSQYAEKLPSVDPTQIVAVLQAINATGIPTLRGMGALSVVGGLSNVTSASDEASMALQTELVARRTGLKGTALYWETNRRKEQGIATPEGLELIRDELKAVSGGWDENAVKSQLQLMTKLPFNIVEALSRAGTIREFLSGGISSKDFQGRLNREITGGQGQDTREQYYRNNLQQMTTGINKFVQNIGKPALGALSYGGAFAGNLLGSMSETSGGQAKLGAAVYGVGKSLAPFAGRLAMKNLGRQSFVTRFVTGSGKAIAGKAGKFLGRMAPVISTAMGVIDIAEGALDDEYTGLESGMKTLGGLAEMSSIPGVTWGGAALTMWADWNKTTRRDKGISLHPAVRGSFSFEQVNKSMKRMQPRDVSNTGFFGALRADLVENHFNYLEEHGGASVQEALKKDKVGTLMRCWDKIENVQTPADNMGKGNGAGNVNINTIIVNVGDVKNKKELEDAARQGAVAIGEHLQNLQTQAKNRQIVELNGFNSSLHYGGTN